MTTKNQLNIKYSADRRKEHGHIRHLGDYSGTEVYITYRTAPEILTDTISLLYLSQQAPFILIVPTMKNVTPEIQQFIDKNKFILLSIADELALQPDGSFKPVRCIAEYMKLHRDGCTQAVHNTTQLIEVYKYLNNVSMKKSHAVILFKD